MVDFGLPSSSRAIMGGAMDSMLIIFSLAFGDKRKPTPPIVELEVFLVAEDVIS